MLRENQEGQFGRVKDLVLAMGLVGITAITGATSCAVQRVESPGVTVVSGSNGTQVTCTGSSTPNRPGVYTTPSKGSVNGQVYQCP